MTNRFEKEYKDIPIVRFTGRFFAGYICAVLLICAFVFMIGFFAGNTPDYAFSRALSVIFISCPLVTIYTIYAVIRAADENAAQNGIDFANKAAIENVGKVKIIALNRTGTVTKGEMIVTDIFPAEALTSSGYSLLNNHEDELVKIAEILESRRDHPIAKAIDSYIKELHPYEEDKEATHEITDYEAIPSKGLKAMLDGHIIYGGCLEFAEEFTFVQAEIKERAHVLENMGKTPVFYGIGKRLLGIIAVSDTIKENSKSAINEFKELGITVIMLTGNNEVASGIIGTEVGVDETIADITPGEKANVINELKKKGYLLMAAEGHKEDDAMKAADISVILSADEEDNEKCDIILKSRSLPDISAAIRLSKTVIGYINITLLCLLIYDAIMIPLAAGAYAGILGFVLHPLAALAIMVIAGAIQVLSITRLKIFDIHHISLTGKT